MARLVIVPVESMMRAMPKSTTRGPSAAMSTLSGLKSRCTIAGVVDRGERGGRADRQPLQRGARQRAARLHGLAQRLPSMYSLAM